ncbi:MAG: YfhO family protein [Mycoplasmatales bacterium]
MESIKRKFSNKNLYIKNVGLALSLIIVFYLLALVFGYIIGTSGGDFTNQHLLFLDYLRDNFWYSHDLFPQLNMNMGLSQSMVSLYYHGLYNPFMILIYFLPFKNIFINIQIVWFLIFILNSLFMTKLLSLNKINNKLNTICTLIFCFSTSIIYHMSYHIMFVYYLPFFILSLIGLHYLVDKNIKSIYIIGLSLVFYTNFFFAPIVSVVQFIYYIGLLVEKKKSIWKNLIRFIYPYLIAVLIGMFILIPTFLFGFSGRNSATDLNNTYSIFNNIFNLLYDISWDKYSSFFGIVTIFTLLGTFISIKQKRYYIMIIPLICIMLFNHLNLFLNVFQYTHTKIYIYMIPIFVITLAKILQENKKIKTLLIISVIVMLGNIIFVETTIVQFLFGLVFIILFTLVVLSKNWKLKLIFIILLVSLNFFKASNFISIEDMDKYNQPNNQAEKVINFREDTLSGYNEIDSITSQSPQIYTSLENSNYSSFLRDDLEVEKLNNQRKITANVFDNIYLKNYLAIPDSSLIKQNGIFYGVSNNDVCNLQDYQNLDSLERIGAINECVFIENQNNIKAYQSNFNINNIYQNKQEFDLPNNKKILIPEQYQNGTLIITFKIDYNKIKGNKGTIKINNHANSLIYKNSYGLYNNEQVTFIIDTANINELNLISSYTLNKGKDKPFSNINVYYQSLNDFNENKLQGYDISNLDVDINDSYNFDISMEQTGYLVSSIPYDKGFKIYVDGQEQEIEKINGRFVGTQLTKGKHHVKLIFHIVGFNIGSILTLSGLGILLFEICRDKKKYSKSRKIWKKLVL